MHVCLLAALRALQEFTPINLLESYKKKLNDTTFFLMMQSHQENTRINPQ
jgi:hypothetical protein